MALGDTGHDFRQIGIPCLCQTHGGQRVIFVRIESRRNNDELRLERVGRWDKRFEEDRVVCLIAFPFFHRDIDCKSYSLSLASFGASASTGVVRILMCAKKKYRGIVLETVLCPIPMMNIPIDD